MRPRKERPPRRKGPSSWPLRPIAVCAAHAAARAGSAKTGAVRSVGKKPGAMRVAGDAVPRPLFGDGAGELHDAALGRAIGAESGNARCDCSEAMLTMRPQPRCAIARRQQLRQPKRRAQVNREMAIEFLGRDILEGLPQIDAGGVDQNIDVRRDPARGFYRAVRSVRLLRGRAATVAGIDAVGAAARAAASASSA